MDWRWYLASCAAPSWLCVILTFFIPESPRWLLNNGDYIKVKEELLRIANWNGINMEILKGMSLLIIVWDMLIHRVTNC